MFNKYGKFGLTRNPFASEAYSRDDNSANFVDEVVADELDTFRRRLVAGAIEESRSMSFLWSLGAFGFDTGYGKTATLRRMAREINSDWGLSTLTLAGASLADAENYPICATYVSFNSNNVNSLYSGLFEAVRWAANWRRAADSPSLLWELRERALAANGVSGSAAATTLGDIMAVSQAEFTRGLSQLRADLVDILVNSDSSDELANSLSDVSPTTRQRSGHLYFQAFLCLAHAAGVKKVFTFLDQIEDLANPYISTKQKRYREVERFRDTLIEDPIVGAMGSFVFTLHRRAEDSLVDAWTNSRLPSFDPDHKANASRVLVLRGLRDDAAAETLVRALLETARKDDSDAQTDLWPFTDDAVSAIRIRNSGRISKFLEDCHAVLAYAAEDNGEPPFDAAYVHEVAAPQGHDDDPDAGFANEAALRGERGSEELLGRF